MAYQPPYNYGNTNPNGPQPPYAYGGQPPNNRDAMLAALQGNNYQYPTNPALVKAPGKGLAGSIADTSAGVIAGTPAISKGIVEGIGGGSAAAGLGGAATAGIGIGTELLGSALKPKVQAPTASPFANITDDYTRRQEGSGEGVLGGATKWGGRGAEIGSVVPGIGTAIGAGIGALAGGIGNAFTKNAASAYSDFSEKDARDAITKLYAQDGQKPPTPQEMDQILRGQGWSPGDRFVGEKGLYSTMANLDHNFRQQALQQQLGGSTPQTGTATAPPGAGTPVTRTGVEAGGITGGADAPSTSAASSAIPADADTDGYAAPAYTAPKVGNVMPGWDATKFADPKHQTPKYVVGRLLSNIAPTTENMDAAVAEIAKAYPGAKRVGAGDVEIPGLGTIDILQAAGAGGKAWQWDDGSGGGGGDPQSASGGGGGTGAGYDASGDASGSDFIAQIIARLQGLAGGTGNGIMSNRDALLQKIGA